MKAAKQDAQKGGEGKMEAQFGIGVLGRTDISIYIGTKGGWAGERVLEREKRSAEEAQGRASGDPMEHISAKV